MAGKAGRRGGRRGGRRSILLSIIFILTLTGVCYATAQVGDNTNIDNDISNNVRNDNDNTAMACSDADSKSSSNSTSISGACSESKSGAAAIQGQGMSNSGNQTVSITDQELRYRMPQSISYNATMPGTTTATATTPFGAVSAGTETYQAKRAITIDKIVSLKEAGILSDSEAKAEAIPVVKSMKKASKDRIGLLTWLFKVII